MKVVCVYFFRNRYKEVIRLTNQSQVSPPPPQDNVDTEIEK